jgi:hypothetical protein
MHRLRAATRTGRKEIEVEFFEGSEEKGFIQAVKANIVHGLPLTLADRRAGAARILFTHSFPIGRSGPTPALPIRR